jgi:O-antigen/teichoic acid export membrane protein
LFSSFSMTQSPLKESLAVRGFFSLFLQIVLRLRGFLLIPVLTRALPPSELGVISLGAAFCAGLSPLLLLGMNTGVSLHVVRLEGSALRPAILTVLSFSALFSSAVTVLFLAIVATGAFGPSLAPLQPVLWPVGIFAVGLAMREVAMALPQARQRLGFIAWNSLLMDFGGTVFAVAAVLLGQGASGALWGIGVMLLMGALIGAVYSLRMVEGPWTYDGAFLRATLRTALPVVPLAFSLWTLLASDYLFVSHYRGAAEVAIYGLAYSLASPALMAAMAMNQTYLPTCVEILREGRNEFAKFMGDSSRLFAVAGVIVIAFVTVTGPYLSTLIGGAAYAESGRVLPIIVSAYLFYSLSQIAQLIPGTMNQDMKGSARAHLLAALCTVAANFVLVPRFGLWGAAWSTCFGYALAFALLARSVRMILPELKWTPLFGRLAVLSAISIGGALFLGSIASGWLSALFLGAGSVLVAILSARSLLLLTGDDLKRLPSLDALRGLLA